MTRKHFHRLFGLIYLCSLTLCILATICIEYLIHRGGTGENFLLTPRHWEGFAENTGIFVFVLPIVITCVIGGLIYLTNKLEPQTDEQRRQSFVERMSKTELFLPLVLILLAPTVLLIFNNGMYTPFWFFWAFTGVHLLVTWLLVLFLKRIPRIKKTVWKVTAILVFLFSALVYAAMLIPTALYAGSLNDYEYWDRYPGDDCEEAAEYIPNADLNEAFASSPENMASRIADRLLEVYNHWDGRPAMLADAADVFLHYDSERMHIGMISYPSDATEEEIQRKSEEDNRYFDNEQELGRTFQWMFSDMEYDDRQSLIDWLKRAFTQRANQYDYASFAKRVDMLDWAYRDLSDKSYNEYEGDDGYSEFYNIYRHAEEVPLKWENYKDFIDNPYVRYTVEDNERDQYLLMWAYTFWGRRQNDDTVWQCRELLEKVLAAHPNTLYPEDKINRQNELMRAAEARVAEFIKWYKANYWSFRELKAAYYDGAGNLVKLDREEMGKYLYALKKSGYLSPGYLKELEERFDRRCQSLQTGGAGEAQGEWLRIDPLIDDYNAIAGQIDEITCRTAHISKPEKEMWIATSIDRVYAGVETIDGIWMINTVMRTGN